MKHCKSNNDIEVVKVDYSNYNTMKIKEVKISIDDDRYKSLKLIDVPRNEDGKEYIEQMLEYTVHDDSLSFEMEHIMSLEDVSALIKALQQLHRQAVKVVKK